MWGEKTKEGKPIGWTNTSKAIPIIIFFSDFDRYFKQTAKDSESRKLFGYDWENQMNKGRSK